MRSNAVVHFPFLVGLGGRVSGWWWRVIVVALACGAGAVVLAGALSHPAAPPRAHGLTGAAALRQLQSLPLQGQATMSAALGSGVPSFAARPGGNGYRLAGGG